MKMLLNSQWSTQMWILKERSEAIELEKLWVMIVIKAVDVDEATSCWENAAIDEKKMG